MAEDKSPTPIAEISHGPSKMDAFIENNQKKLIILAIGAVVALVFGIIYSMSKDIKGQDDGSALYNASGETELREAIKDAPNNTKATGLFLLAKEQLLTEPETAISTLVTLLADHPGSAIQQQAKLTLGQAYLKNKDTDKAKHHFGQILQDSDADSTKAFANLALADIAKQAGEVDKAKEYYTAAEEFAKNNQIKSAAKNAAEMVTVAAPKVIIKQPELPKEEPVGDKSKDDKSEGAKSEDDKSAGDKSEEDKSEEDKSEGDKPVVGEPAADKPAGGAGN